MSRVGVSSSSTFFVSPSAACDLDSFVFFVFGLAAASFGLLEDLEVETAVSLAELLAERPGAPGPGLSSSGSSDSDFQRRGSGLTGLAGGAGFSESSGFAVFSGPSKPSMPSRSYTGSSSSDMGSNSPLTSELKVGRNAAAAGSLHFLFPGEFSVTRSPDDWQVEPAGPMFLGKQHGKLGPLHLAELGSNCLSTIRKIDQGIISEEVRGFLLHEFADGDGQAADFDIGCLVTPHFDEMARAKARWLPRRSWFRLAFGRGRCVASRAFCGLRVRSLAGL